MERVDRRRLSTIFGRCLGGFWSRTFDVRFGLARIVARWDLRTGVLADRNIRCRVKRPRARSTIWRQCGRILFPTLIERILACRLEGWDKPTWNCRSSALAPRAWDKNSARSR